MSVEACTVDWPYPHPMMPTWPPYIAVPYPVFIPHPVPVPVPAPMPYPWWPVSPWGWPPVDTVATGRGTTAANLIIDTTDGGSVSVEIPIDGQVTW